MYMLPRVTPRTLAMPLQSLFAGFTPSPTPVPHRGSGQNVTTKYYNMWQNVARCGNMCALQAKEMQKVRELWPGGSGLCAARGGCHAAGSSADAGNGAAGVLDG